MTPYEQGKRDGDERAASLGLSPTDRRQARKCFVVDHPTEKALNMQEFAYCGLVVYTDGLGPFGVGSWPETAPERRRKQEEYARGYFALDDEAAA